MELKGRFIKNGDSYVIKFYKHLGEGELEIYDN